MINIIYGLRDPRNDVYQYIGKSTVGNKRALQHLTLSHSERVNEWVKMLADNWLYPQIDIIEEVENIENLPEREKYWVDYYHNLNPELLNIQLVPPPIVDLRTEEEEETFNFLVLKIYEIPKILRRERIFRRFTQEEMAKHMDVSKCTIATIEKGGSVSFNTVQKYVLTLKGLDLLSKRGGVRVRKKHNV